MLTCKFVINENVIWNIISNSEEEFPSEEGGLSCTCVILIGKR